ncbi:zinc ribbon domain-containing protein [Roseivivax sediminis]|uniref:zinc ribbon domain-containing protein n=1 Tax=Roseivivax sediminis TaxID=936889 RepID=UPI00165F3B7D
MAKKLAELNARYGIEIHKVEPAYTSKTCSACGYVDGRQRSEETYHCRHCGRKLHADVNGARNIAKAVTGHPADHEAAKGDGRSARPGTPSPAGRARSRKASSSPRARSVTLRDLVRRFGESIARIPVESGSVLRGQSVSHEDGLAASSGALAPAMRRLVGAEGLLAAFPGCRAPTVR